MLSREEVSIAYRLILGREPESEATVIAHQAEEKLERLGRRLLTSDEFRHRAATELAASLKPKWVCSEIRHGLKLWLDLSDLGVSAGCLHDNWEPAETEFILSVLAPGDVFLDVGANIGWFSILAAHAVGPEGRVYAFEPREEIHRRLVQSVAANKFEERCHVERVALGAAASETELAWIPSERNPGHSFFAPQVLPEGAELLGRVPVRTIDSFNISPPVRVVKIDVEGAEPQVLDGARGLIARDRPILLLEIFPQWLRTVSSITPETLLASLRETSYRVFRLTETGIGRELHPGDDGAEPGGREYFSVIAISDEDSRHLLAHRLDQRVGDLERRVEAEAEARTAAEVRAADEARAADAARRTGAGLRAEFEQRIAQAEARLAEEKRLRAEVDKQALVEREQLGQRLAKADRQLAAQDAMLASLVARAEQMEAERDYLRHERDDVLGSTFWRLTGPGRRLGAALPPALRRQGRRVARIVYWLLTPHRTRERIAYFRSRERDASAAYVPDIEPDQMAAGINPFHYLEYNVTERREGQPAGLASPAAESPPPYRSLRELPVSVEQGKALYLKRCDLSVFRVRTGNVIQFPSEKEPYFSVVISAYGGFSYNIRVLEMLEHAAHYTKAKTGVGIEVVVIDNGSSDETVRLEKYINGIVFRSVSPNIGFPRACNLGASLASGSYLVFLNNDVEVEPDVFVRLYEAVEADKGDVACFGGAILQFDGSIQDLGSGIWRDGVTQGYFRNEPPTRYAFTYPRDVDYVAGCFFCISAAEFRTFGGFDERYSPGYYEESDLALRLWKAGRRSRIYPDIGIYHLEFGTFSSSAPEASTELMVKNRAVFAQRHKDVLDRRPEFSTTEGYPVSLGGVRPRLLFIEDKVPSLRLGSGFGRSELIVRKLIEVADVDFFACDPASGDLAPDDFQYIRVTYGPAPDCLQRLLSSQHYDTIYVCRPHNFARYAEVLNTWKEGGGKIIYDTEAIFAVREVAQMERAESYAAVTSSQRFAPLVEEELRPAELADLIIAVNKLEAAIVQQHLRKPVLIIGHYLAARPREPDPSARAGLLFVGALHGSAPNFDSIVWFLDDVWPRIQAQRPGEKLRIAGFVGPGVTLDALQRYGVTCLGFLPELTDEYSHARIFIAPTRYAAGIPFKVHEAFSYGLPVVCSRLLHEQLACDGKFDQVVSKATVYDDGSEFANACLELLRDDELWLRRRQAALAYIADTCSPDFEWSQLQNFLRDLGKGPSSSPSGPTPQVEGPSGSQPLQNNTAEGGAAFDGSMIVNDRPKLSTLELDVSQRRWRGDEPDAGLTWGTMMAGDPFVDILASRRIWDERTRIVEIGPGYGRIIEAILQRGLPFSHYTGLELSAARIARLKKRYPAQRVSFIEGDILGSVTLGESADLVFGAAVFEHFYPDFGAALRSISDLLAPDGILVFDLIREPEVGASVFEPNGTYIRWYTRPEVENLLRGHGYDLQTAAEISYGQDVTQRDIVRTAFVAIRNSERARQPTLCVCAIFKDEGPNLDEWVAYHRIVGVDHFVLYDNGSSDDGPSRLREGNFGEYVTIVPWPLRPGQQAAYEHFRINHSGRWDWVAFIDVDEFIYPTETDSVKKLLTRYDEFSSVLLHWLVFGPNGHETRPPGLVIDSYTRRFAQQHEMNRHIKSIVRCKDLLDGRGVHHFSTKGQVCNAYGAPVPNIPIQETVYHDVMYLNHYRYKSREEWAKRVRKRRADVADADPTSERPFELIDWGERDSTVVDERITRFSQRVRALLAS
jgi:FkbM family methyltransferase